MLIITLFLVFFTIALTGYTVIPVVSRQMSILSAKRQHTMTSRMEQLLPRQEAQKISKFFFIAPILLKSSTIFFLVSFIVSPLYDPAFSFIVPSKFRM